MEEFTMFFNEYELHQIVKLRQEETEKKALNAWKHRVIQKESFLQKTVRKWNNREKSVKVQTNCGCACPFQENLPCG
jgi:hypothetical protein